MLKVYPKDKIIVSACLLGEYCRYDGQTKYDKELLKWLDDKEVIPFCPEDPLFGTPRPAISVVQDSDAFRLIRSSDHADIGQLIINETQRFIDKNPTVKWAVLKSKSPSCGFNTTPIYDKNGVEIAKGDGFAASLMKKHSYIIRNEINYKDIKEEND